MLLPYSFFSFLHFIFVFTRLIAKEEGENSTRPVEKSLPQRSLFPVAGRVKGVKVIKDFSIIDGEPFAHEGSILLPVLRG
jgi:hypothetical protein